MEEKEKNEFMQSIKDSFAETFTNLGDSITSLQTDIQTMKDNPPKPKSKLDGEQNEIRINDLSAKVDTLSTSITDFFEKMTEKPKNKPSFLDLLFGGGEDDKP